MPAPGSRPNIRVIKPGTALRPQRSLSDWIRAWKIVIRDPDKPIPDAAIPPEGQPIPADIDIHCQHCGRGLGGVTEWACPGCGEQFNPIRLYTIRMMQEPEYFLRYRLDPDEIRKGFHAAVLFVLGFVLTIVATIIAIKRGNTTGWLPIGTAWRLWSGFLALAILPTLLLHFALDFSWARIAFFFAVPWLLLCAVLFVLTFI